MMSRLPRPGVEVECVWPPHLSLVTQNLVFVLEAEMMERRRDLGAADVRGPAALILLLLLSYKGSESSD
jgi:hypothetical protein